METKPVKKQRNVAIELWRLIVALAAIGFHAGYIIAPSDHFFFGDPANLKAFTDACKECVY